MFTTPRKGGASSTIRTPKSNNKVVPLKGYFADGIWHCNCNPRLPASYFKVKKDGNTKGRGFYTCPKGKEEASCDFFLWEDDAVRRDGRTAISNSRSGPSSAMKNKATRPRVVDSQSTMNTTNSERGSTDEEDFGEWPLTNEDDKELIEVVEQLLSPYPETPRKTRKTNAFTTPGTKRKRDEADSLPTPATKMGNSGGDIFTTPATSRTKGLMWDRNERLGLNSPSITPTPGRFRDTAKEPDINSGENYEITGEVMELLKDTPISEHTSSALRSLLNIYAMKASGIAKGRDITRIALKSKDEKITELQQRISALENEREIDKAIVKEWKNDIRRYTTTTDR